MIKLYASWSEEHKYTWNEDKFMWTKKSNAVILSEKEENIIDHCNAQRHKHTQEQFWVFSDPEVVYVENYVWEEILGESFSFIPEEVEKYLYKKINDL